MSINSILKYAVVTVALSTSFSVLASEIETEEKGFVFNWNNPVEVPPKKTEIKKVEAFLKTIPPQSKLAIADRQALGKLFYKLGTYYSHSAHKPDLAIASLNQVDKLLVSKDNKAWTYNQLAYAYEQKFAATKNAADKKKALALTSKVINEMYPNKKNKEVAFAYSVKGLIQNDAKNYKLAEQDYKTSLKIYASLPSGKDDQYQRGTTILAGILLNQKNRETDAFNLLNQVKHYWIAKGHLSENPNAAANFISLGKAYLKVGNTEAAHVELCSAMNIYKNVYGDKTSLLAKPYTLLAATYKKQGNLKLAALYQGKANAIAKA